MKKVGAWSIDIQILNWIDTKFGSKSAFVNKVLREAYVEEVVKHQKWETKPKCPECKTSMSVNTLDDGDEWICRYIHCKAGMV